MGGPGPVNRERSGGPRAMRLTLHARGEHLSSAASSVHRAAAQPHWRGSSVPRARQRCRQCRTALPAWAFVAALSAAACGGDSTKPAAPSLSGTYELIEVNGTALPFTIPIQLGFYQRQIVGGTLEFRDQNRVLDALSLRNVDGAGAPLTEAEADTLVQTYTLSGTEI